MNERKRMFILIPILILVWGLVIYHVYDAVSDDVTPIVQTNEAYVAIPEKLVEFELALNYPDPFLQTAMAKPVVVAKKSPTRTNKRKPEKRVQTVPKPALRYSGRIENLESNEERHLISVNGNPQIVTLGQEVDGVVLKKVFADSVEFKWNKETIFVRR